MCSIPILWWKCLKNSQHLIWLGHSWLSPSPEMECPGSASHRPQAPIEVIEQGEPGSESGGVLSSLSWAPEDKHHPLPVVLGPIHQQRPKPSASTKMTLKNLLKRQTPKSKDAERKRKLYNKLKSENWLGGREKVESSLKGKEILGFPGGSVVKDPPTNTGDMGSIPGLGRSHMSRSHEASAPQLLKLCSRAQELQLLRPTCPWASALQQKRPLKWEVHAPQLEKSLCSNNDPAQPKINTLIK